MERRLRPDIFALYLLAAVSCKDDNTGDAMMASGSGGDAGGKAGAGADHADGGRGGGGSGGRSGGGGLPAVGSECRPESGVAEDDAGSSRCTGGIVDWMMTCKRRYEQVQCYVSEDGACLPPDTDNLAAKLSDFILSAGFSPEFVLDSADQRDLPESCAALLQCCSRLTTPDQQRICGDRVDGVSADHADRDCSALGTSDQMDNGCQVSPSDSDAGAQSPVKLCCYHTCGHLEDT